MAKRKKLGHNTDPHPVETREKAFQLYKRGNSHKETSALLTVPEFTVAGWAARFKWRMRKLGEEAGTLAGAFDKSFAKTAHVDRLEEGQAAYEKEMQDQALRLPAMMREMNDRELLMAADKIGKLDATNRKALRLEGTGPSTVVNVALLSGTEGKRLKATILPALPTSDTLDLVPIVG